MDAQISFESYERTRLRQEETKQAATVNLSDEEPLPRHGPDGDKDGVGQRESNPVEKLTKEAPPQPSVPGATQTPSKEPVSEQQPQLEQQQILVEPLETLEQSILDILDEE